MAKHTVIKDVGHLIAVGPSERIFVAGCGELEVQKLGRREDQ